METQTIRVYKDDMPRLEAKKTHPRETPADVVKRLLDKEDKSQ